ncbi:MAG: tRNA pseudouridine(38-40) synthase TruA [Candidatus Eisenbacteria bacterium]|nr:tRNA pseudouridine(38-40) synthase TruA [Candidatus Eisenbacteria bacterium]
MKLTVAYDGTAFHGWQRQPDRRTVQGVLEESLAAILGESIGITGAGRTDAGCHARGQVASFVTGSRLPVYALPPTLNRALPGDVRVRAAEEAGEGFNARRSAIARRYAYRLLNEDDLLHERYAWHPRRAVRPDALERATRVLEGEHDFSVFRATGSTPAEPRCAVSRATWRAWEGGVQLDIVADHFLYHMVRGIVGTALAVQDERDPAAAMRERVASRDRARSGATAPPQGLTLEEVFYPEEAR